MIVNFNLEKLNTLLFDFYKITGLTISVWDADLNQLCYYPKEMIPFCKLIRTSNTGTANCLKSDKKVLRKALESRRPQTHKCHAGLNDTAIPIIFKDTILGFLMFGQSISNPNANNEEFLLNLSNQLNLDASLVSKTYREVPLIQADTIDSAANILKMATRYLWLSDMIKITQDDLLEKIKEYVKENASDSITVNSLCKKFYISRNKLYALIEKRLHCTIGAYVRKIRIDKAKALLSSTDSSIGEIASLVGFAEYNYFIKIFKNEVGLSPLQYRKQFLS